MTRLIGLVVVALGTGCPAPRASIVHPPKLAAGQRHFEYSERVDHYRLQNGMEILVVPDEKTNLVTVDVRYRVGAAEDPRGKAGLAHLVEHMTYRLRPSEGAGASLTERLNDLALYFNAYTNWDETHYTAIGYPADLPTMLAVEAERLKGGCTRVVQEDLAHEREVVRNEIRWRGGVFTEVLQTLRHAVYGTGHAYERYVGGTDVEIAAITRDDVCGFMEAYYVPERAILVVSGNVNRVQVPKLVAARFGGIEARAGGPRKAVTRPRLNGTSSQLPLPVEESTAIIAFAADPFYAQDVVYQHLLVRIFQQRLFALLEEHPFLTNTAIGLTGGVQAPLLVVVLSVKEPDQMDEAVQLFFDDVQAFLEEELQGEMVVAMHERLRASLLFGVEPFMRRAGLFADQMQYADNRDHILRDLRRAGDVTGKELQEWGKALFRREASHILYIRPDLDAVTVEERAALRFTPKDDTGIEHVQRVPMDPAEAERPLAVPERRLRMDMRRFTVNGMNVILVPHMDYHVVDIRLVFPAGSLHEPADKPGLARTAMELLEPRNPKVRSMDEYQSYLHMVDVQQMGGAIERTMNERATIFRTSGLGVYMDGLLWSLHWLIENGGYSEETLERRRKRAARQETAEDEPERRWLHALLETLFGAGHPYASQGESMAERLKRLSIDDLERFRDAHYRLRGATLIVSGRFDAALAEAEIRRLYAWDDRPRGPEPRPVPAAARRDRPRYLAAFDDSVQTEIMIAFDAQPGFSAHHAARRVLREMMEDRLSALREVLGAAYGVSVSQVTREGPGVLMVHAAVDRERAGEAFVVLQDALAALRTGDITADFVRARRHALRQVLADSLHSQSVAGELALLAAYDLPPTYYEDLARRVATLRPADIQALIARELDQARQVVFVRGRRASVEALYRAAKITGYRVLE